MPWRGVLLYDHALGLSQQGLLQIFIGLSSSSNKYLLDVLHVFCIFMLYKLKFWKMYVLFVFFLVRKTKSKERRLQAISFEMTHKLAKKED